MTHPTLRPPSRPTLLPRARLSALLAAPLALALLAPGLTRAATLDADATDAASTYNVLDNPAQPFSTQRTADTTMNLGRQGTTARFYQTLVFPFQLPYLGVGSTPFQTASFTFRLTAKNGTLTGRNADLYALPPRFASDVLPGAASASAGDFFMGGVNGAGADDTTPGVIKLQDNIMVAATAAGAITTDAAAGTALVNYLNAAYEGGAGAGKWVFLRLSMDADPGGVVSYVVGTVNNTTAANRPFITFTAVTNNPTEFFWTGLQSGEWSLNPIDGPKNWTADGAPADYTNATAVVFNDSATGSRTVDLSITDVSPATVVVSNSAGAYTLQGSRGIAQAFRLTKDGSGLLVLATSNNYSGPTTVAAGTLQLGAAGAIPDGAGKGDVSVSGTLDLNGFSEGINGLSGSGLIDNTAAGAVTLTVGGNNKSGTFNGLLQQTGGTVSLTKTGNGTLTLAGANTYAGATLVQTGTVTVTHGSGLGTTAGGTELTASGAATGPRVIVSGGITIAENFLLGGATDAGGGNAAILSQAGTNTLTGSITLSNLTGAFRIGVLSNSALSTLNLSGSLTQVGSTQALVLAALNNALLRVNTPVANNGAELQVISTAASGSGVVQLNAASGTGLGQTRVSVTGTLQLGVTDALNSAADLLIGQASGNTSTLAGNDIGRVDLNGFNLAVNALNGFANTTTNAAAASRRVITNSAASGSSTLTVGGGHGSGTFNGAIVEGAGSTIALVKNGSGNQSLNGTNTYSGPTTVNAGKLLVNGATGPSAVSVQSGATLGGTGLVGGAVTANTGSTVSPGPDGGVGRLTVDQSLILQANSTLAIQLNGTTEGTYDQVASTLDYFLQQPKLVVTLGYTPAVGDQYLIVSGGPLAFPDGQFAGLPDGATFGAGGSLFLINYRAGDGNDVLLTCLGTPSISSAGPLSGGSFPLTFSGPPGQAYQVLTSTNVTLPLTNWTVLTSGTFTATPVTYTDTGATNAQRFYRLKLP